MRQRQDACLSRWLLRTHRAKHVSVSSKTLAKMKLLAAIFFGFSAVLFASEKPFYEITEGDRKFLADVLSAVARKDAHWIAAHSAIPLVVETPSGKKVVKTEQELALVIESKFSIALCTKMQLDATKPLFRNCHGIMLGDGILWFEECKESDTASWKQLILAFGYFAYQPEETEANQSPEPMPMAVTPPAAQASRQP